MAMRPMNPYPTSELAFSVVGLYPIICMFSKMCTISLVICCHFTFIFSKYCVFLVVCFSLWLYVTVGAGACVVYSIVIAILLTFPCLALSPGWIPELARTRRASTSPQSGGSHPTSPKMTAHLSPPISSKWDGWTSTHLRGTFLSSCPPRCILTQSMVDLAELSWQCPRYIPHERERV